MAVITLGPSGLQPFSDYLKFEKRYSPHTQQAYLQDLEEFRLFVATAFGTTDPGLQEINHTIIRSWLAAGKENGLSARTLNRKISTLKSFFKFWMKQGALDISPMARVISPKAGGRLPVFVKEEDTIKLVEALSQSADDWKSLNAKMLITIFYATGMRLSELLQLREKQVDPGKKQIKVLGKGNKERILPVSAGLIAQIKDYIRQKKERFGDGEELLLVTEKGKKLYPRYAWQLVNQYLGMASTLDKRSPHVLRHTFATHLMNNGAGLNAVKELLGHSSLAATQVYTHNSIEKLRDIHKKAHPKA